MALENPNSWPVSATSRSTPGVHAAGHQIQRMPSSGSQQEPTAQRGHSPKSSMRFICKYYREPHSHSSTRRFEIHSNCGLGDLQVGQTAEILERQKGVSLGRWGKAQTPGKLNNEHPALQRSPCKQGPGDSIFLEWEPGTRERMEDAQNTQDILQP